MKSGLAPRLDILPAAQRAFWPGLRALTKIGMVLHGGTAIALRLGHRSSVDFDFFTERPLDRRALHQAFPILNTAQTLQDESDTLTVLVNETGSEPIKLSFFGSISFGRVGEPSETADGVAVIASLEDLFAQKLKVVMQRIESKDYRDIAAILRHGLTLHSGMSGALALFGPAFSPAECAKALVHFKGGDLASLTDSDKKTLLNAVRDLPNKLEPARIVSPRLA
jgi:hypothetical protein